MKNSENFTVADYYVSLLTRLSDNKSSFVISTVDITKEIALLDKELGVKVKGSSAAMRAWSIRQNFCKYFKDYIKDEVLDESYKGRGNRYIYSIELAAADRAGMVLKIQNKHSRTKNLLISVPESDESGKKVVVKTPKADKIKKEKCIISGKKFPRKDWIRKFFDLCVLAKNDPEHKVSKKQIQTVMKLKFVPSIGRMISDWQKTLVRGKMICRMDEYIALGGERFVKFYDPVSAVESVGNFYRNKFGVDLDVAGILHTTGSTQIKKDIVHPVRKVTDISFDKAYSIFVIAGLIKKYKRLITFDQLYKVMMKEFNISLIKSEVIELIKENAAEYFDINTHCGNIGINLKSDVNWEEFNSKFSPRNFTRTVIARIGMTMEEISKRMPNNSVKVLSKISDNDFIYELGMDRSIHSLREFSNLYRSFRGSDQIFDPELVKEIENAIIYSESRAYNVDEYLAYSIEF